MNQNELIEIWTDIKGYEGLYQVSNLGRVKSLPKFTYSRCYPQLRKEKLLKPRFTGKHRNYAQVRFNDGKSYKVHRLVAQTFIPNPNNLPLVNHKDENTFNNCVDNLEWCTNQYNCQYSAKPLTELHKQHLRKPHKPVSEQEIQRRKEWANSHKDLLSKAGKLGAERRWRGVKS